MRVKKTSTNNEYLRCEGVWVRNFARPALPLNISPLYSFEDYQLVIKNEEANRNRPKISEERLSFPNILIVSDGFNFEKRHKLVESIPGLCILAVNGALKNWKSKKTINAYVANNPYAECLRFLPSRTNKYYPVCIASIRVNAEFVKSYLGEVYLYCPVPEKIFGVNRAEKYYVDDYRNPICAAISLAYQFGVQRLMLMSCDESFEEKRDGSVQLPNKLWTYPQHLKSQAIIDGNLYWLTHQEGLEVRVADYSDGADYKNAAYISNEEQAIEFFVESPNE